MTHANAPLSLEGRRRLVERCRTRPISHVAAEMGISRAAVRLGGVLGYARIDEPRRNYDLVEWDTECRSDWEQEFEARLALSGFQPGQRAPKR